MQKWGLRSTKNNKGKKNIYKKYRYCLQIHYLFKTARIRIRIRQSYPDQYQIEKQDLDLYQIEKQNPDPYIKYLDPQHCRLG
jgi:hypothetical protein